jgi:hypothetical protein
MDIEKQTKDVMLKAISNFSKKYEVTDLETQLMIRASDDNCTPKYQVLVNNKLREEITFNEILNVKIDFLGREMIVSPFISSSLRKLRREHECKADDLAILIYKKESNPSSPYLYFFEGTKAVKPIDFQYIFGDMN